MIVAKQMEIRSNIKKFFDLAYSGETILVPRKENKNVVILSEDEYKRIRQLHRITEYGRHLAVSMYEPKEDTLLPDVKQDNLNKLASIADLKDGWNGNGSPAIPPPVVDKVRDLLQALPIQPEIFPTALQSIQLEFDNARRDHMEIEVDSSDLCELFIVTYFGSEITETIASDPASVSERVLRFYG